MRFRKDNPEDLARARTEVAAWRADHPGGTGEALVAALGHRFHPDYGPVLRAVLFTVDRHHARQVIGAAGIAVQGLRQP